MHADRIDAGLDRATEHGKCPRIQRTATRLPHHVVGECAAIVLGLEPEQVELAHRANQRLVRRVGHEHRGRRKRRVQEQAHAVAQPRLAQRLRQAEQVVVVCPDQIVRPHQSGERLREQRVHPAISGELRPVEVRVADLIVQRRPQRAVGEAAVERVVVAAGQIDRIERDRADRALDMRRRDRIVGDLAAPAEPDAALLLQRIQHAGRQPAGGRFAFSDRRNSVGDDDKAGHSARL